MSDTKYYLEYIHTGIQLDPIATIADNYTKLVISGDTVYQVTGYTNGESDKIFTWTIANPAPAYTYLGPRLANNMQVRNVYAYVSSSTNCVINIYYGSVGSTTTLLSSNLTVTTSESSTTSFTTSTLSTGAWLTLRVVSKSGYPGILNVNITLY